MSFDRRRVVELTKLVFVFVAVPLMYLAAINLLVPPRPVCFKRLPGADFLSSVGWKLVSNVPANASLTVEAGILKIRSNGSLPPRTIVSAQTFVSGLDLPQRPMLLASVRTNDINVAARIALWPNGQNSPVLLKTYIDQLWHREIVDLSFFRSSWSNLTLVELGLATLESVLPSQIEFRDLEFGSMSVCGG